MLVPGLKVSEFEKAKSNDENILRFNAMKVVSHVTLGVTCRGVPFQFGAESKPSFFRYFFLFPHTGPVLDNLFIVRRNQGFHPDFAHLD